MAIEEGQKRYLWRMYCAKPGVLWIEDVDLQVLQQKNENEQLLAYRYEKYDVEVWLRHQAQNSNDVTTIERFLWADDADPLYNQKQNEAADAARNEFFVEHIKTLIPEETILV
jgi:hypothetical protein